MPTCKHILVLTILCLAGCSFKEPSELELATQRFRTAQWDDAIQICTRLIDGHRDNAEAWLLRGRCYVGKGMPARAIQDYSEAIRLRPKDAEPLYHRAIAYDLINKPELAQADGNRARRLDVEVHKAQAMVFSPFGDFVEEAVDSQPRHAKRRDGSDDDQTDDVELSQHWSDATTDSTHDTSTSSRGARPPSAFPSKASAGPGMRKEDRSESLLRRSLAATAAPAAQSRGGGKPAIQASSGVHRLPRPWLRDNILAEKTGGSTHAWQEAMSDEAHGSNRQQDSDQADGKTEAGERPEQKDGSDAQESAADEPETAGPEEETAHPRLPSGMYLFPDNTASSLPHTGYPYSADSGHSGEVPAPRRSSSFLGRLYSVPSTRLPGAAGPGFPGVPTELGPAPAYQRMWQSRKHSAVVAGRHGQLGGPVGVGAARGYTSFSGNTPQVLGPLQSMSRPAFTGGFPATLGSAPAFSRGVPSPPADLPTTGVVQSYDGM